MTLQEFNRVLNRIKTDFNSNVYHCILMDDDFNELCETVHPNRAVLYGITIHKGDKNLFFFKQGIVEFSYELSDKDKYKKCNCNSRDLFNFGCKCGGI